MAASPPPIFVVNLASSQDRLGHMQTQLGRLGLEFRRFEAVDGREAGSAPSGLSAQEWGCLRSHLAVQRTIVDEDLPFALILEDDVELLPGFRNVLLACARADQAELVLFGHHSARAGPRDGAAVCFRATPLPGGRRLARVAEYPMGAYAYAVTRAGAEKLLRFAEPVRMPADWVTGYAPLAGVRIYGVSPPCVVPDGSLSADPTITDRALGTGASPAGRRTRTAVPAALGRAWLRLRQLGVFPSAYRAPARARAALSGR